MLIDWFTVIAQLINFLVLVWLLQHFLYHPILNAIDEREKRIAAEIADADEKKSAAMQQRDEYQEKNSQFEQQSKQRRKELAEEVNSERTRLLDLARKEADELRSQLQSALQNEQQSLQDKLRQQAQDEVFAIARKALTDLADRSLETSMTDTFIRHLQALDAAEKANLVAAFNPADDALTVRTAFTLPDEQRSRITDAIKDVINDTVSVRFVIEPALVSGIEINANGQKIGWSIAAYLASLTRRVKQLLQPDDPSADHHSAEDSDPPEDDENNNAPNNPALTSHEQGT